MAAPQRMQVIQACAAIGPCSIAEIAEHTGRAADSLYRHVGLLERHGLVVRAGSRKKGRHTERLYDLAADFLKMRLGKRLSPADRKLIHSTGAAISRGVVRELGRSLREADIYLDGPKENLFLTQQMVWFRPEDLKAFRAIVRALDRLSDRCRTPRGGVLFSTFLTAFPVPQRRRVADHAPRGKAGPAASRKRRGPARTQTKKR
jgi:DNA-binding transcriptional ArsR family regulator